MDKIDNKEISLGVTIGDTLKRTFSVSELLAMKLPGMSTSAKWWYDKVKKEHWEVVLVPGKGGRYEGKRREYVPPPEILNLIKEQKNQPTHHQVNGKHAVYDVNKKSPQEPSAVHFFLVAMAVSDADWLPDSLKQDDEAKITLTLDLLKFLRLFLGYEDNRWGWIMEHKEVLQDALRFVYAINTMNNEIDNASNKNNNLSGKS